MQAVNWEQGRAAQYLAAVNIGIVKSAAVRRMAQGRGDGARPPASIAGPRVHLVRVSGADKDPATPAGYQTAVRAAPRVLAALKANDPRRTVATLLADAFERVGSIKGADLAGTDSKGGLSDGGATTRVKHAARLRLIEYLANGWPVDRASGPVRGGRVWAPRLALEVQRRGGKRQDIQAFDAVVAVCVEGMDLAEILRRHGWSVQAHNRDPLRAAVLATLGDVADGLGLSSGSRPR